MLEYRPITSWADDDRPREKLLLKGKAALSDAELIAIIIGSGTRETSAVDLSKEILSHCDNDLNELGKRSVNDLMQFKGIGEAKAISIVAAAELGRRRRLASARKKTKITSSRDSFELLQPELGDLDHEVFMVIFLNQDNKVIDSAMISSGGVTGTVVDPRTLFRIALERKATGIIIAHNHPSGSLRPSQADINLTKKISEAGRFLDIRVLDHLIITQEAYFSFADEDMMT